METKVDNRRADSLHKRPKRFWTFLLLIGMLTSLGCEGSKYLGWLIIGLGRAYFGWYPEVEIPAPFYAPAPDETGDYHTIIWGYNFIEATGVFTPTDSTTILDEFGAQGYLALRVPHAPPTYTASSIVSPTLSLTYYAPPTSTTPAVTTTTFVRRAEYETAVNAAYSITDDKSHWEVWWLPDGQAFPTPDEPFRTEGSSLRFDYYIDLRNDVPAGNCAGCPIAYLIWNGYTFIGPFQEFIALMLEGDPAVTFDMCGSPSNPSMLWFIRPSEPITHEHCLENDDSLAHTFDLDFSSSQNWDYTYYMQANQAEAAPAPLVGNQVSLEAYGAVRILAVITPPVSDSDTLRETFSVRATAQDDPTMWAEASSLALAPAYQLDEGDSPQYRLYLPLVLRQ